MFLHTVDRWMWMRIIVIHLCLCRVALVRAINLYGNDINQGGEPASQAQLLISSDIKQQDSVLLPPSMSDAAHLIDDEFQIEDINDVDYSQKPLRRDKKHEKERRGPKIWDQWGKWSACSVTCGVGKIVRWRHCVSGGCAPGEKEAQIKTCTLPSC